MTPATREVLGGIVNGLVHSELDVQQVCAREGERGSEGARVRWREAEKLGKRNGEKKRVCWRVVGYVYVYVYVYVCACACACVYVGSWMEGSRLGDLYREQVCAFSTIM
jgi:hypothetical protein